MSLKAAILSAKDIKEETVIIPEWGDIEITVRGLNAEQMSAYEGKSAVMRSNLRGKENKDFEMAVKMRRAEMLVDCLFDPETGLRIFTIEEAKKLAKKSAGIVNGLFNLAHDLSDMERSFDKKVDDAVKNSESDPSLGCNTATRSRSLNPPHA